MLNIQPITLLRGPHHDTAATGQGCFMNVIAYLNGEPQITDQSPCVCETARPIAIVLNDRANDEERRQLLPFIERAMGSVTHERDESCRRGRLAVEFAQACSDIAQQTDRNSHLAEQCHAYAQAAKAAIQGGPIIVPSAAASEAYYAAVVASAMSEGARVQVFQAGLKFLDAALPPAPVWGDEVHARARELVKKYETVAAMGA
jgi:hypothetical protein